MEGITKISTIGKSKQNNSVRLIILDFFCRVYIRFSPFVGWNPSFLCFLSIIYLLINLFFGNKIVQERIRASWTVVDARTLRKEDIQKETVYCLNDDDETEVPKEDTIQGMPVRVSIFV